MKNPSLREQPRSQAAPIMEPRKDASIIGWLENSGRLMEREETEKSKTDREDGEDISALMAGDDFKEDEDEDDEGES